MTTYERVVDGEVVERVTPIDGSHEDTRIGVLVLEGGSEWRLASQDTAADDPSTAAGPTPEPTAEALSGPQNDEPTSPATPDQSANADEATKEVDDGAATTDGDGTGSDGDKPRGSRRNR